MIDSPYTVENASPLKIILCIQSIETFDVILPIASFCVFIHLQDRFLQNQIRFAFTVCSGSITNWPNFKVLAFMDPSTNQSPPYVY